MSDVYLAPDLYKPGSLEEIQAAMAGAPEGSELKASLGKLAGQYQEVRDTTDQRFGRGRPASAASASASASASATPAPAPISPRANPPVNPETGGYRPVTQTSTAKTTTKSSPVDQAAILDQMNASLAGYEASTKALNEAAGGITAAGAGIAGQMTVAGAQKAAVVTAQGAEEIARAEAGKQIVKTFNIDPMQADNQNAQAEARRVAAHNAMRDIGARINEEEQVTPWDDPLRWIVNQFTLPYLHKSYAYSAQVADNSTKEITERNTAANSWATVATTLATPLTVINNRIAAQAQSLVAEAGVAVAQVNAGTAQTQAQFILHRMASIGAPLDLMLKTAQTFMTTQAMSVADKEANQESPGLAAYNTRRISIGLQPTSITDWKQMSTAERNEQTTWAQSPTYGPTPGAALTHINKLGGLQTMGNANPLVFQKLQQLTHTPEVEAALTDLRATEHPESSKFRQLPPIDQRAAAMDAAYGQQWADLKNGKVASTDLKKSSPYYFAILGATTLPELATNWVSKDVADKRRVNQNYEPTAQDILDTFHAKSKAEPQRAAEFATELTRFFRTGQKKQWQDSGAMMLGVEDPEAFGYSVKGHHTSGTTDRALQLLSPTQLLHWTILRTRQEAALDQVFATQGIPDDRVTTGGVIPATMPRPIDRGNLPSIPGFGTP